MRPDQLLWAMVYANIVGFQFHPGANRDGRQPLTFKECAVLTDMAVKQFRERVEKEEL